MCVRCIISLREESCGVYYKMLLQRLCCRPNKHNGNGQDYLLQPFIKAGNKVTCWVRRYPLAKARSQKINFFRIRSETYSSSLPGASGHIIAYCISFACKTYYARRAHAMMHILEIGRAQTSSFQTLREARRPPYSKTLAAESQGVLTHRELGPYRLSRNV